MRRVVGISALVVGLLSAASAQAAKTPGVAWSPSGSYGYGTLNAADGGNASQTFTLRNTGGKPTGTLSISLTGSSAFTTTADTCTGTKLSSKRTCSVTVKYAPTANGSDSATLSASAANTTGASVSLTGSSAWQNGDITVYNQTEWGNDDIENTTPPSLLTADFNSVYTNTFGVMGVGSTFTLTFDSASALFDYLPQTGPVGVLTATANDPTDTASGGFGGDVVALKLNVDFADASLLTTNSGLKFGDLTICGLTSDTDLNAMSVRSFLALANTALGGGSHTDSIDDLETVTSNLNGAFIDGTPSTWAQDHVQPGSCP